MHTREARADDVSEQRVFLLDAWRHADNYYSAAEQAAFGLAEAITELRTGGVTDEVYAAVGHCFTEEQTAHLIFVATVMNSWNRLAITARLAPRGGQEPPESDGPGATRGR